MKMHIAREWIDQNGWVKPGTKLRILGAKRGLLGVVEYYSAPQKIVEIKGDNRAYQSQAYPGFVLIDEIGYCLVEEVKAEPTEPAPPADTTEQFAADLDKVFAKYRAMLITKNKAYGNSALNPIRVFAKEASTDLQLRVRIDDKLNRLLQGHAAGEDTSGDLLGYLVMREVLKLRESEGR